MNAFVADSNAATNRKKRVDAIRVQESIEVVFGNYENSYCLRLSHRSKTSFNSWVRVWARVADTINFITMDGIGILAWIHDTGYRISARSGINTGTTWTHDPDIINTDSKFQIYSVASLPVQPT